MDVETPRDVQVILSWGSLFKLSFISKCVRACVLGPSGSATEPLEASARPVTRHASSSIDLSC